jgi:hypothetical protein
MNSGPISVRTLPRGLRIYVVVLFALCGGFFVWLASSQPDRGHEIGYVMGALFLWLALWGSMRPEFIVVADESGLEYADERLGILLQFPIRRAAWSDVTRIDTRVVRGRYGHWLLTRVWVRDAEAGSRLRSFAVRSRRPGYAEFLELLAARTVGHPVETTGYGLDTQRALADDRSRRSPRVLVAIAVALAMAALLLALRVAQHR